MKLKAFAADEKHCKRILVSYTNGKQLAIVHCDGAITFNGSHEFYPKDWATISTIAENFNLFYDNIQQ